MINFIRHRRFLIHVSNSGQALLLVIVAMVIILTVSLSVATRSVINVRTSSEEASSQQAFSAAEAGVEKFLKTNSALSENIGNATVNVTTQAVSGTDIILNNGNPVLRDDGVDLWLSTYPTYAPPQWGGTLSIFWGTTSDCSAAAIEVIVVSGASVNAATMTRSTFDPCAARAGVNNFTASTAMGGTTWVNRAQVTVTNGFVARIIPLYKDSTTIRVTGPSAFPSQGTKINSVAALGDTKRKITVFQGYPKIPNEFFSYALFSP